VLFTLTITITKIANNVKKLAVNDNYNEIMGNNYNYNYNEMTITM